MRNGKLIGRILGIALVLFVIGTMLGPLYAAGDRAAQDVSQVCADNVTCTEISKVDNPPVFDTTKTVTITPAEDATKTEKPVSVAVPDENGGESKRTRTKTVVIAPDENVTGLPVAGDLMFCYFSPHQRRDPWNALPQDQPLWDFMIMYGPDTITGGGSATVFGHIVEGLDALAVESIKIRVEGTKWFRVSRLEE